MKEATLLGLGIVGQALRLAILPRRMPKVAAKIL
jgi:hypothetical protein